MNIYLSVEMASIKHFHNHNIQLYFNSSQSGIMKTKIFESESRMLYMCGLFFFAEPEIHLGTQSWQTSFLWNQHQASSSMWSWNLLISSFLTSRLPFYNTAPDGTWGKTGGFYQNYYDKTKIYHFLPSASFNNRLYNYSWWGCWVQQGYTD